MSVREGVRAAFDNGFTIEQPDDSPDEKGDDDPQHCNEGSSHFSLPDSLAKQLVSADPSGLPETGKYALYFAPENSESQQRLIAQLIDRGECGLANEISACRNVYRVHECGDCEGESTTTRTCNRADLCEDCSSQQGGIAQGKYGDIVTSWSRPTYICLKLPGTYSDPSEAREAVLNAFNSFKRRKVTPSKNWLKKLSHDPEFVERIQREYLDKNHGVPMSELLEGWIFGRHTLYQEDSGRWKVHIDMLANARYIPSGKGSESNILGDVWERAGGEKESVQIMRVKDKSNGFRTHTAILKTLAYVTDKVACDDPDAQVDYHLSTKGEKRSFVGGSLHGNSDGSDNDTVELCCGHCGSSDLRHTGFTSSKPDGSTDAIVMVNGDRIRKGNKFANLIPSD